MPEPDPTSLPPANTLEPPEAPPPEDPTPMLDVHPAHHAANSWRDFFVHIATIVLGLIIAVGLEQSVEWVHHTHQRHQLQEDLLNEARQNQQVIARDLRMQETEPWFEQVIRKANPVAMKQDAVHLTLPAPPCVAGSVGTAEIRYFAPSQAVWTTAQQGGLVPLLPVDQARLQARLAHNYELLGVAREQVANGCLTILAMRRRFAQPNPSPAEDKTDEIWTMTPAQAELLASTATQTQTSIQGLLFRLRWSQLYEEGIVNGDAAPDVKMMTINQERFEDQPTPNH
jgi:hypothetical protein